jgi:hypothetical protein
MRKTKENLAKPPDRELMESREAQETANEEHYEEIGGESSTEGVGPGFDADVPGGESEEEKAESTADGPLSGDVFDPPITKPGKSKRRQRRRVQAAHSRSNHPAARSSKTI